MKFQTTAPLRLGFIGGGCNSEVGYAHYCASQLDGEWNLVAGCFSREQRINIDSAKRYGVAPENTFSDWQEMLTQCADKLDAVVVLTPTPMHEAIVTRALAKGLAVICEKTLTDSVISAEKINKVLNAGDGQLLVAYNYSAYPMIRELQARIAAQELGQIQHIEVEMPQEGLAQQNNYSGKHAEPQQCHLKDGSIPNIHLDLTTNLHHLIYFLTHQTPIKMIADHNNFGCFDNVVDDATALVKYDNNLTARYWVSKSALDNEGGLSIRVSGDLGSAQWMQSDPEQLLLSYVNGEYKTIECGGPCLVANQLEYNRSSTSNPSGFVEAFANLYRDFSAAVRHPKSCRAEGIFRNYGIVPALEGLYLMEAMTRSNIGQQWERLRGYRRVQQRTKSIFKRSIFDRVDRLA